MREGGRRDSASRVKEDQQNLAEYLGTPNSSFVGYRAVIQQLVLCIQRNCPWGSPPAPIMAMTAGLRAHPHVRL